MTTRDQWASFALWSVLAFFIVFLPISRAAQDFRACKVAGHTTIECLKDMRKKTNKAKGE
jgi:hypothetical protein